MELGTVSNFEKNIKAKLNLHVDKVFLFLAYFVFLCII